MGMPPNAILLTMSSVLPNLTFSMFYSPEYLSRFNYTTVTFAVKDPSVVSLLDMRFAKSARNHRPGDGESTRDAYERMKHGLVDLFAQPNNQQLATEVANNVAFLSNHAQTQGLTPRHLVFEQFLVPATPANVARARNLAAGRAATVAPMFSASHLSQQELEAIGAGQNPIPEYMMSR